MNPTMNPMLQSCTVCLVLGLVAGLAAQEGGHDREGQGTQTVPSQELTYKMPMRGAPRARVSGGTRGRDDSQPALFVLTPDHAAQTIQQQPTLYWYQSEPCQYTFELAMTPENDFEPVLELSFNESSQDGIVKVDLARHATKLEPGVRYQWVVAVVIDPKQRSKDVSASGYIERIEPSEELSAGLADAHGLERAKVFLNHGIWYDGLDVLSRLIDEEPDNATLRSLRASLMDQVGLSMIAQHDRTQLATP